VRGIVEVCSAIETQNFEIPAIDTSN